MALVTNVVITLRRPPLLGCARRRPASDFARTARRQPESLGWPSGAYCKNKKWKLTARLVGSGHPMKRGQALVKRERHSQPRPCHAGAMSQTLAGLARSCHYIFHVQ